jgi:hypothetical protein
MGVGTDPSPAQDDSSYYGHVSRIRSEGQGPPPNRRRDLEPHAEPVPSEAQRRESQLLYESVIPFSAAAAIVIVAMSLRLVGALPGWGSSADVVSAQAREARVEAFLSSAPLSLQSVAPAERGDALTSMKLDESSRMALGPQTGSLTRANETPPVRLAWITFWDTDDEDGDVVRIDSQGYTRTISLLKQPVTIAIPVPADGVINVTGVRDGEGGGITVGAASSGSQVVLPIMSVGQVIGLHVRER